MLQWASARLRHPDPAERTLLMDRQYWPHHRSLNEALDAAMAEHGHALIVDVHSFSPVPLLHEADLDPDGRELCIGFDAYHSPFLDDEEALRIGKEAGFATVALNRPLSGSIVPGKHWR